MVEMEVGQDDVGDVLRLDAVGSQRARQGVAAMVEAVDLLEFP